jgi:uncharacterized protein
MATKLLHFSAGFLLFFGAICMLPAKAEAAGFNCANAKLADEKAVCHDKKLSTLDDLLNRRFQESKKSTSDRQDLVHALRNFLSDRKDCGEDRACILSTYIAALWEISTERDADLGKFSAVMISEGTPTSFDIPTVVGQCAATKVELVHSRLEGDDPEFEMGIGVDYANGGYGVSYSREEPVARSTSGDPVIMCLIEIDRDCPPDSSGHLFFTTNMRTKESWILPDAQHKCGG